jgi:hypothetical protein
MAGGSIPAAFLKLLPKSDVGKGPGSGGRWGIELVPSQHPQMLFLIPLGRFPGFVWLIAVGFLLPKTRPSRPPC